MKDAAFAVYGRLRAGAAAGPSRLQYSFQKRNFTLESPRSIPAL